jgi:arylsulfatase K
MTNQPTMNRREFVGSLLAGSGAFSLGAGAAAAKTPNVLYIECDSMDGRVMGCMGEPSASTPNLDRLAAEGVVFANTYCNSPLCVPSRACKSSGLHTHKCEGWNNHKGLEPGDRTFDKDLRAGGYLTEFFGKNDYLSGGHTVYARVGAWTRSSGVRLPMISGQKFQIVNPKTDPRQVKENDWNKKRECEKWLEQHAASGNKQPFFLYCGITYPHPAYRTSEYWRSRIDAAKIAIPPKDQEPWHPGVEYMKIIKSANREFTRDLIVGVRQTYRAMIAEVDCIAGELIKKLNDLGLRETTCVIFSSDHGDMQMEHNLTHKQCLFEGATRVPMIVAGPGVRRGAVVRDLVSLVDVYPTLMDMAGLPTPKGLDGRSLMPLLRGESDSRRPDWVLSQYHGDYSCTGSFMLRQGDWKYIAWAGYEPQLFNLKGDPWEMTNRANEHPDVAKEMDGKLRGIVDIEATDAKVKAYDKASFRKWRAQQSEEDYMAVMKDLYKGFAKEHQRLIDQWLAKP